MKYNYRKPDFRLAAAGFILILFAAFSFAQTSKQKDAVRYVRSILMSKMEPGMTGEPFADWFQKIVGQKTPVTWSASDCGEDIGTSADDSGDFPICVGVIADISKDISLNISLRIDSFKDTKPVIRYIYAAKKGGGKQIDKLSDLPATLSQPAGTVLTAELIIPKPEGIKKITAFPSEIEWFTPESLLRTLPQFVRGGHYKTKMLWQSGTIELKNGAIINWSADSKNTLKIYSGNKEAYFHLPLTAEKKLQIKPVVPAKMILRGSVSNSYFQMTLERDAAGRLNGSYFYDKSGAAKTFVLRGTIDQKRRFTLREFTANGRQTGVFTGRVSENPDEFNMEFNGEWRNLRTRQTKVFYAKNEEIDFDNDWQIATKLINENDKQRRFEIDASYPEITGGQGSAMTGFNQAAKSIVTEPVGEFREQIKPASEEMSNAAETDNSLYINYHIRYAGKDFISVEYFYSNFMGQAHAESNFYNLNYDLRNNRRLELADLFKADAEYLKTISAYCLKKLQKRPSQRGFNFSRDLWKEGIEPLEDNYQNWYLTKTGLLIIFGSEQIAPYSVDPQFVLIPFIELKEIAAPGGALAEMIKESVYEN